MTFFLSSCTFFLAFTRGRWKKFAPTATKIFLSLWLLVQIFFNALFFHWRLGSPSKRLLSKLNIDHRSCPIANKNCVLLCRSNRVCYHEWGLRALITSWYPNCNGSHFGLPPSEIHRMTGLPPKIVWTMTYSHRPHQGSSNPNGVYSLKWRLTDRYLRWGTLAGPRPGRADADQWLSAGTAHLGFPALLSVPHLLSREIKMNRRQAWTL